MSYTLRSPKRFADGRMRFAINNHGLYRRNRKGHPERQRRGITLARVERGVRGPGKGH